MEATSCCCPVADVICRTLELGLSITGARVDEHDRTVIEARPTDTEGFCPSCGAQGVLRDHVVRELVDVPVAGHPSRLRVRVGRFRCLHEECGTRIFPEPEQFVAGDWHDLDRAVRFGYLTDDDYDVALARVR